MRILFCSVAIVALAAQALGQTDVTGDIGTHTTWGPGGSPYIIHGSIFVLSAATLTIEPGVVVKFSDEGTLWASGGSSIYAVGTQGDPILFTSNSDTPAPGDWTILYVADSPSSEFSHCTFEYGQDNLYIHNSATPISYCTIRHASSSGLFCDMGATCHVTDCNIINNSRGIKVTGSSSPVINNCNIFDNPGENLGVSGFADLPAIRIDMENNWWGVDTYGEILDTITIQESSEPYVEIDFDPWLHSVPIETVSWGWLKALYQD